jgi:hypothetical protein
MASRGRSGLAFVVWWAAGPIAQRTSRPIAAILRRGVDFAGAWVPIGAGPYAKCSPCSQRDQRVDFRRGPLGPEGRAGPVRQGCKRARAQRPRLPTRPSVSPGSQTHRRVTLGKPQSLVLLLSKVDHAWRVGVVVTEDDPKRSSTVERPRLRACT